MNINLGDILQSKSDGRLWWVYNHLWSSMVWTIVDIDGDTRSIASHQCDDYITEAKGVSHPIFERYVSKHKLDTTHDKYDKLMTLYEASQARCKRLEKTIQTLDVGYDTPRSKYL